LARDENLDVTRAKAKRAAKVKSRRRPVVPARPGPA
jgi:hypothetical protein